jgi:uncharacterized membrane protein
MKHFFRPTLGFFPRRQEPDRPKITPEMAPVDWFLEGAALLALLILLGFVYYSYRLLPDTIATHFNARGEPDDYGNKSAIFFLPAMGLFVYGLMTLINRTPHLFNFPVRITPQNAMRQYTLAIRMLRILKLVIILLFFFISRATIVSAGGSGGLGLWFMPVFLSLVFIPLIVYFVMASQKR